MNDIIGLTCQLEDKTEGIIAAEIDGLVGVILPDGMMTFTERENVNINYK